MEVEVCSTNRKFISLLVSYVWLYANVGQPYRETDRTTKNTESYMHWNIFFKNAYFLHLEHVLGDEIYVVYL